MIALVLSLARFRAKVARDTFGTFSRLPGVDIAYLQARALAYDDDVKRLESQLRLYCSLRGRGDIS